MHSTSGIPAATMFRTSRAPEIVKEPSFVNGLASFVFADVFPDTSLYAKSQPRSAKIQNSLTLSCEYVIVG